LTRCDIEAYPISFGERFEPVTLDLGKVDEHVWSIILLDEPEAFCIVKPFHCPFCHLFLPAFLWKSAVV